MRSFCLLLAVTILAGCAGTHPKGVSRYDEYDAVKVDQMVGNYVSGRFLGRTVVCLNARRETRSLTAVTNFTVRTTTNQTVLAITNQTFSVATNYLVTLMTNLAPMLAVSPAATLPAGETPAPGSGETNLLVVVTNPGPAVTTNLTVSTANNQSVSTAPNQTAANSQSVRSYNSQITTTASNVSISVLTNRIITSETNQVVSYLTNLAIVLITNVVIAPTNLFVHDYFLYSELIPPPDFTLQSGESLVLLVDGVRHGFSQGQSGATFVSRDGFTSGLYRVPPEVLVAIANAKEVKVRFKGFNSVLERTMTEGCQQNFREFLLKFFSPEPGVSASTATIHPNPLHMATR